MKNTIDNLRMFDSFDWDSFAGAERILVTDPKTNLVKQFEPSTGAVKMIGAPKEFTDVVDYATIIVDAKGISITASNDAGEQFTWIGCGGKSDTWNNYQANLQLANMFAKHGIPWQILEADGLYFTRI